MYEDLIKRLRNVSIELWQSDHVSVLLLEAADAIEELSRLHEAQRQNLITLMNEEPEPKWIPVTERLPDMHVEVLVCTEEYGETQLGFSMVAVFDGTGWLETWGRKTYLAAVTHWMPLPEPPKEE